MSTGTILAIVIPVAVVLAVIVLAIALDRRRRNRLRERFGTEYDRTVDDAGSKRAAEYDLGTREKRHEALDIKPLPSGARERYADRWRGVQSQFVDRPEGAVHDADSLVTSLMRERGYPTEGFEQQSRDLSVEHGQTLEHYRAAHEINTLSSSRQATTEQLRGAMVHYRALFDELLSDGDASRPGRA
ncbi:hypothetical protein ACFTUC_03060 [Streptomyces sp. NPDC056944]|uniref:hypothetical protein n=1 Tax=Streptomyces sp. NPDC056944 TaxID=3345972 RepID=UPI00363C6A34